MNEKKAHKRIPVLTNVFGWDNYLGLWSILSPQTLTEQPQENYILRKYNEPKKWSWQQGSFLPTSAAALGVRGHVLDITTKVGGAL